MTLQLFARLVFLCVVLTHAVASLAANAHTLTSSCLSAHPSVILDTPTAHYQLWKRGDPGASSSGSKDSSWTWGWDSPSYRSSFESPPSPAVPWHKFKEPLYSSPVQHWRSLFRHGPPQTKSEPVSPQKAKEKSKGRTQSLPASPGTPAWSYHSFSSLGSFRASPESVKSQPPSPKSGKKQHPLYTLTAPKKNTWFGWFKKERHITAPPTYKNDKLRSPAHLHDRETRKYKTFFYGKKAKEFAKIVRPSTLRSQEGHEKQTLRKLIVKTSKKLGAEFG